MTDYRRTELEAAGMTDYVATPQCLRCGGVHSYEGDTCLRDQVVLRADVETFDLIATTAWRRVAPADCIGIPAISMQYAAELQRLAQQQGLTVGVGDHLSVRYRRIDDEWWPIPESLRVAPGEGAPAAAPGEGEGHG